MKVEFLVKFVLDTDDLNRAAGYKPDRPITRRTMAEVLDDHLYLSEHGPELKGHFAVVQMEGK